MLRATVLIAAGATILVAAFSGSSWAYPDGAAGSIPLSIQPLVARIHPAGRYLYVGNAASSSLAVVDTLSFSEVRTVALPGPARDLGVGLDGSTLYVITNVADQVTTFDLSDPSTPSNRSSESIGTSSVFFDRLAIGGTSGADLLVLLDRSNKSIYLFDVAAGELRSSGSDDHVTMDIAAEAIALTTSGTRIAAMDPEGLFRTYSVSSLGQVGGSLDVGPFASTPSFVDLAVGNSISGNFSFLVNDVAPGELFLVNMTNANNTIFVQDANTTTGGTDPVTVGDGPTAVAVADVVRPDGFSSGNATYAFVSNSTDSTLSVLDTADVGLGDVEPLATIEGVANVPSRGLALSSASEGYLYALNEDGHAVTVVTDQPFVTVTGAPSDSVATSNVSVTVTSSKSGDLSVLRYTADTTEAVTTTGSDLLATTNLTAGVSKSVSFPVAELVEGINTVAYFVRNGELLGRTAIEVTKDTIPPTPQGFSLTFGNEKIIARWGRVDVADLDHYLVYFGTSGPSGGVGSLSSPISVAPSGGDDESYVLTPVANGTTVFVEVTAVDQTGHESPPTETLSETAEETIGLIGLTGESGGCRTRGAPTVWIVVVGLALLARHRRNARLWLGVGVLLLPIGTHAETIDAGASSKKISTSTDFRVGWWLPQDTVLEQFFGNAGNLYYLFHFGVVYGPFDVGVESGVMTETAPLIGVTSGRASGEEMRLTNVPIDITGQYNLYLGAEPLFVPFVKVGYDMQYFSLDEPTASVSGLKHGLLWSGGLRLHFEQFSDTNDLEEFLGVTRFFIEAVVTYRWQMSGGMDLGGWVLQPGLGLEF